MANFISSSDDQAVSQLHDAIIATNVCMEVLAKMFPSVTFLAAIDRGQPVAVLAYATSTESHHLTPGAMNAANALAEVVTSLPDELLEDAFRIRLHYMAVRRKIQAEMEKAVSAALAAADQETHLP